MRKFLSGVLAVIILLSLTLESCDEHEDVNKVQSSFDLIQHKILNVSCAIGGCHLSESDLSFKEHMLVLQEGLSYENLIERDPVNEEALHHGLKLVKPGDDEQSLLLHKLHCHKDHHHEHDFGNLMPMGREPLSAGQIEFITRWIQEGASHDAIISADTNLLNDNIPDCEEEEFMPLEPPVAGEGFQVKVEPFIIPSQFEREIFVYKEVGNEEPIYVNRIQMKMRKNSHHFLINTFEDDTPPSKLPAINTIRDLRDANNRYLLPTVEQMEYQIPTIASQTPELDYQFPKGVALKIPAKHKLDINLHYVNKSQQSLSGECFINLYNVPASDVANEAKPIFFSFENIRLPPHEKTIIFETFIVNEPMEIFMLTSHTHKLSERFEVLLVGGPRHGEIVYASSNWHHPAIKTFDTPIHLNVGEGLKMVVTYNNTTSKPVRFGLTSEDEMSIIYGYYY
jgi:hypothetical protein